MTARQMQLALSLLAGLMVVSIGIAAARLTWRLAADTGPRPTPSIAVATPAPPVDLEPILRLAPFGVPVAVQTASDGGASGLQLRGILRARVASASSALISSAGGPSQPFFPGQSLPGGALVEAIEADHVILSVNGRRQLLTFPAKMSATTATASSGPSGVDAIRAAIPASVSGIAPAAPPPPAPGPASGPASAIESYRDRIAASPETLVGALGATSTPQGYRIGANISPDMRLAGLLPGDVIQKINGAPVGDAERDRQLFEQAVAAGRARVEVLRDGRQVIMSFPLR